MAKVTPEDKYEHALLMAVCVKNPNNWNSAEYFIYEGVDPASGRKQAPYCPIQLREPICVEKNVVRKDLFEKLSEEALEVVDIIFNSPAEVLASLRKIQIGRNSLNKNNSKEEEIFHKNRIAKYLRKTKGRGHYKEINETIKELEQYAMELGDL